MTDTERKSVNKMLAINTGLIEHYAKLRSALKGMLDIVYTSHGVSGYHLNGDIAEWGEFEEVTVAEQVIRETEE